MAYREGGSGCSFLGCNLGTCVTMVASGDGIVSSQVLVVMFFIAYCIVGSSS